MSLIEVLISLLPQFAIAFIVAAGWFGSSSIKSSANKLGVFVARGGGDKAAVEQGAAALTTSVLAVTTFTSTFFVSVLDLALIIASSKGITALTSIALVLYLILISTFLNQVLGRSFFEISLAKVQVPFSGVPPKFFKSELVTMINRMTLIIFFISIPVAFLAKLSG